MDKFRQARKELQTAERAISSMKKATNFDEFEESWKVFLACIEKCWIKAERCCQSEKNKFQPWQGLYVKLRKKDRLLHYLKQARDADHHSIQEIVEHKKGGYGIRSLFSRHKIEKMIIQNHVITEYKGDPILVESFPEKIELLRFKNRGKWFNPPTQHLNKKLTHNDPISIAEKGLEFYRKFLSDAEEKFN